MAVNATCRPSGETANDSKVVPWGGRIETLSTGFRVEDTAGGRSSFV